MCIYMVVVARSYYTLYMRAARALRVGARTARWLGCAPALLLLLLARRRTDAGAATAAEGEKEKNGAVGQ